MFPRPNPLKEKLAADQSILGLFVQSPNADIVEIAAAAGFDYVIIDQEHGSIGLSETIAMIRSAEAAGICPIVRVPDRDPRHIRRAAEAGAMGVYVPDIRTAEQARAAVAAVKFASGANGAHRGACPTIRAARLGASDWRRFVEWSNENVLACLMVESEEGVANLDAILAVPGIDIIVLGRFDIWHQKGLAGDRYHPEIDAMFDTFAAKARQAGVRYVARLSSLEPGPARQEWLAATAAGARVFNLASDRQLIYRVFRQVTAPLLSPD